MTDRRTAKSLDDMPIAPGPANVLEPLPIAAPKSHGLGPLIFRNVLTLIGGQGLNVALSGTATILLARYLGAA